MLEEWDTPGAVKGGVLMGSQVVRKFWRPYQMSIMSGQRSSCGLHPKCDTEISVYYAFCDFIYNLFHRIKSLLCSP